MSSSFSRKEIARLAALARLALTDEETALFSRQLGDILSYVEEVRAVDTTGVPPTSHTLTPENALRDDEPRPSLSRDAALANAPDASMESGLFHVPRVIG